MTLNWTLKPFDELALAELYELLRLRVEIFVVEQNCPFQDIDGMDNRAYHLLGYTDAGELAAYARLFDADISYAQVAIGRVAVGLAYRRHGLGQELMTKTNGDQGYVGHHQIPNELFDWSNPREIVVRGIS